jgi:hypothetical protein
MSLSSLAQDLKPIMIILTTNPQLKKVPSKELRRKQESQHSSPWLFSFWMEGVGGRGQIKMGL